MSIIPNGRRVALFPGDCLESLKKLPDNSVDSIVTDPPYGLSKEPDMAEVLRHWLAGDDYHHKGGGFMGKAWDSFVPGPAIWRECLRVLKPGGHLLSFFGSRTYDMGTLAIRLAGFEVRDQIMWVYGSGFPKSLDVSKAIDKAAGVEREVIGQKLTGKARTKDGWESGNMWVSETSPATDAARQWQGWGTALKPAHEPICVARKPLEGTVASNVLQHGTGALNIDGCRVGTEPPAPRNAPKKIIRGGRFHAAAEAETEMSHYNPTQGRWPANLAHDGSEEVLAGFPKNAGAATPVKGTEPSHTGMEGTNCYGEYGRVPGAFYGDKGSAARFFYCAKSSKADREEGLAEMPDRMFGMSNKAKASAERGEHWDNGDGGVNRVTVRKNNHPTVKPTSLMQWLCRLITPPGGIILDPFMGSGSTGKAAMLEGFRFVGCELDPQYMEIAKARIRHAMSVTPANDNTESECKAESQAS